MLSARRVYPVYPKINRRKLNRRFTLNSNEGGFVQIIIVAIIALAFGAIAMFGYQKYFKKTPASVQKTEATSNSNQTVDELANVY